MKIGAFLYLEAPIVTFPHHRLDKLGSLGFSLMPTPLGSPRALSSWDAGLQEETPVPNSPDGTCASKQELVPGGCAQRVLPSERAALEKPLALQGLWSPVLPGQLFPSGHLPVISSSFPLLCPEVHLV